MNRREMLRALSSLVLGSVACLSSLERARAEQKVTNDLYARCAKACSDCRKTCQVCAQHCNAMVKAGMKEHVKTMRLSEDNEAICAAAASICARRGPLAAVICQACIKACNTCGAECGKYPNMKEMKDCAQSCKVCVQACQEMVAALKA
jgi:hypothetical protein